MCDEETDWKIGPEKLFMNLECITAVHYGAFGLVQACRRCAAHYLRQLATHLLAPVRSLSAIGGSEP